MSNEIVLKNKYSILFRSKGEVLDMKKFILRGKKRGRPGYVNKSLEYGVWYELVTPFDWQYFKIKKGSRYVSVYDFIGDKKPAFIVTRKRFIEEILNLAKSPPRPVRQGDL